MADENKEKDINEEQEMDDMELAELANKELNKKEDEIRQLKQQLAKAKLFSRAENEDDSNQMTREECIKVISDSRTTNYDYAKAVCNLVDIEVANGRENPLGSNGKLVYDFFKDCIEECGDDKGRFTSIYQSRIGNDDPKTAFAYRKRNK